MAENKRLKQASEISLPNAKNENKILSMASADNEYKHNLNTYQETMGVTTSEVFVAKLFNDGIVTEVLADDLKKYLANPEVFHAEIEKIAMYYYISNGDVFQLFDLAKVLPSLNYAIETEDKSKNIEKNTALVNKTMKNIIKHKQLTRDLVSQVITAGTVVGIWLGDKRKPYLYVFDNLEYAFPAYREEGEWVVWVDLAYFDLMSDTQRNNMFETLNPYITKEDYLQYKQNPHKMKYVQLPNERAIVLRTHTVKRNQRLGMSWATQGLYDILHKKKLKDMEITVANKIINSVAVLTIGNEKNPNLQLNVNLKKKVFGGVKTALEKGSANGVTCLTLPEWAELEFPNLQTEALNPKKFETISSDIEQGLGVSGAMKNGTGTTFASGNINFETFFHRLAVLLEEIETEVYGKLLKIILPVSVGDNYAINYDKLPPLTNKEKIDILLKLHNEGFSIKAIIDRLGMDFSEYINQTMYEQNTLDLTNKVVPYQTSSTIAKNNANKNINTTDNTGVTQQTNTGGELDASQTNNL